MYCYTFSGILVYSGWSSEGKKAHNLVFGIFETDVNKY